MKRTIEIEILQASQIREYADTIYAANIIYNSDSLFASDPSQKIVLKEISCLVYPFKHIKQKGDSTFYEPYLDILEKKDKGKWFVRIVIPFTG